LPWAALGLQRFSDPIAGGRGTYPPKKPHPSGLFEPHSSALQALPFRGPHNVADGFAPLQLDY